MWGTHTPPKCSVCPKEIRLARVLEFLSFNWHIGRDIFPSKFCQKEIERQCLLKELCLFFNLLAVNLTFVSQDKGHAGDLMFFIFSTAKWKCYFEVLLKKKRVSPSSAERQNFSHPYILFFFFHFESIFQLYQKKIKELSDRRILVWWQKKERLTTATPFSLMCSLM